MTETTGLDIREKGRAADGREIALDRRLFMQLLAFGDCRDTALLTAALDEYHLPGVLYADINDPRVASAALMVHVMDADGIRRDEEFGRLRQMLGEAYGLDAEGVDELLQAGEEADKDAVDLYAFTSVITRHLDHEARLELVELLWEMVYADGELHELEDNVVWRIAELIHVERNDRIALRQRVETRRGGGS